MNTDRIDLISIYCDGWCARCAYTARCASFAFRQAFGMCGDVKEAIDLVEGAAGRVIPVPAAGSVLVKDPDRDDGEWVAEYCRRRTLREARVRSAPLMTMAWTLSRLSSGWLESDGERILAAGDAVLREALEVARRDALLIPVKLARAARGRDDHEHGGRWTDDPVQNDWNGSAKLALISLERSEVAWRLIAQATGETTPAAVAAQMADLRREAERCFPDARAFVRPGFDEPWR
jgi:hypothetical protein